MKKRWLPVLLAALLVGLVLTGNAVSLPFADVSKGAWYYDAVQYVYENDLFRAHRVQPLSRRPR